MRTFYRVLVVAIAGLVFGSPARAQPPMPTAEHEQLSKLAGTWEATVTMAGMESKGTMTYKQQQGGFWLVTHFIGEVGGQKFEGNGLDGYDPVKKKFVSIWTDSMAAQPMISEGTWDKEKNQMTMLGLAPGPDGKPVKTRTVTTWSDQDNIEFILYMPNPDGKEQEVVKIAYKRKKLRGRRYCARPSGEWDAGGALLRRLDRARQARTFPSRTSEKT
jgi:hypothetical protein